VAQGFLALTIVSAIVAAMQFALLDRETRSWA